MAAEEPIIVGKANYPGIGDAGVCIFINARDAWQIQTDPQTGTTTITIPGDSGWQVTTDTFGTPPPDKDPGHWQPGQSVVSIFFKDGELNPEDEWTTLVFKNKTTRS